MFEPLRPTHVTRAIVERNTSLVSHFASLGGQATARKRKRRAQNLPLFVGDLDPNKEYPRYHVLYRGPHFSLLKRRRYKDKKHWDEVNAVGEGLELALFIFSPLFRARVARERGKLDEEAHINECPLPD